MSRPSATSRSWYTDLPNPEQAEGDDYTSELGYGYLSRVAIAVSQVQITVSTMRKKLKEGFTQSYPNKDAQIFLDKVKAMRKEQEKKKFVDLFTVNTNELDLEMDYAIWRDGE